MGTNLSYYSAILLLGIYPKEWKPNYHTNACVSMFTTAKFMIANLLNYPRCSTIDEWITKLWDKYTREFYFI